MIKSCIFRNFLNKKFSKIRKFSPKLPTNSVFRPNAQKSNAQFVNFFEKYYKILHFEILHSQNFENFLKNNHQIVFFVQTRKKLTHSLLNFLKNIIKSCIFLKNFHEFEFFVQTIKKLTRFGKFFEKYAKIIHLCNILKNFFENFHKISYVQIMHFRNIRNNFFGKFSKKFLATPLAELLLFEKGRRGYLPREK